MDGEEGEGEGWMVRRGGMRRDIQPMGKNYRSISSMEKFFFISCVYPYEEREG